MSDPERRGNGNETAAREDVKQESPRAGGAHAASEEDAAVQKAACLDCGAIYADFPLDTTIPDEQWLAIVGRGGGLLCASCIVRRGAALPGVIALRGRFEFSGEEPEPCAAETARLRTALERAERERTSAHELRRASNANVMAGLRRLAVALEDDEPQDLGAIHFLASLVESVVRWRKEAEARAERAEKERDELRADKAFWETMTSNDRVQEAEQERTDLQTQLRALQAQHSTLQTQLRDGIRAVEQEGYLRHKDGCERVSHRRSDDGGVTFAWPAKECTCGLTDRLAQLLPGGE